MTLSGSNVKQATAEVNKHGKHKRYLSLRAWRDLWCEGNFTICLQGDNVTALIMALRMQSPAGGVKEIARYLALEFTKASFVPMIIEHIPGIANEIADVLSRRRDPSRSSTWKLPP